MKKNKSMLNRVIVILLFGLLNLLPTFGADQVANRICDTIHYEFMQDKIIIPVKVNGVQVKYIVDTGGQTGTDWESVRRMGGIGTGTSNAVTDFNGMKQLYQMAEVKEVELSPNYKLPAMRTMVLPRIGSFQALGVAGILGGDVFAQSVVTFDARKQIMVINYPYRPERLKITDGVEMFGGSTHHSIVRMSIGGVEEKVLFDTGAGGFLTLSTELLERMKAYGKVEVMDQAFGIPGIGLEGLCEPVEIDKVNVKEMKVLGKRFVNVGCLASQSSSTLVGVDLLQYGKVVIDYMRSRMYFFPYDEEVVDMGGAPKLWNVGILPANERFEITTIWSSMQGIVNFGEQVVNINGLELAGFPFSQPAVDSVMNTIADEKAYIIVMKDGNKRRVEIERK